MILATISSHGSHHHAHLKVKRLLCRLLGTNKTGRISHQWAEITLSSTMKPLKSRSSTHILAQSRVRTTRRLSSQARILFASAPKVNAMLRSDSETRITVFMFQALFWTKLIFSAQFQNTRSLIFCPSRYLLMEMNTPTMGWLTASSTLTFSTSVLVWSPKMVELP
jgi:hypothetical protein